MVETEQWKEAGCIVGVDGEEKPTQNLDKAMH